MVFILTISWACSGRSSVFGSARAITIVQHNYGVLPNFAIKMEGFFQQIIQKIYDKVDIGLPYNEHLKTAEVISAWEFIVELFRLLSEIMMEGLGEYQQKIRIP